jgi:hypothetical protein
MHAMRTRRHTARTSFSLSMKRALAALYKRRGEIEHLISCLESRGRHNTHRPLLGLRYTQMLRKHPAKNHQEKEEGAGFKC